jgi:hypothetical protein
MPILPLHPFKDLEDTEFWEQHGINMRLRAHLKKIDSGSSLKTR